MSFEIKLMLRFLKRFVDIHHDHNCLVENLFLGCDVLFTEKPQKIISVSIKLNNYDVTHNTLSCKKERNRNKQFI